MTLKKVYEFHKKLQEKLGEDLVYGLALDNDMYILTVSTHKSLDQKFSHGREMQTCRFAEADLDQPLDEIIDNVVELYKAVLAKLEDEDVII